MTRNRTSRRLLKRRGWSCFSIRMKGLDIFWKNHKQKKRKNTVISPYSIIGSLYMVAAGAGGESRQEIFESLSLQQYFTSDKILEPFESYHFISKSLQANSTSQGSPVFLTTAFNDDFLRITKRATIWIENHKRHVLPRWIERRYQWRENRARNFWRPFEWFHRRYCEYQGAWFRTSCWRRYRR